MAVGVGLKHLESHKNHVNHLCQEAGRDSAGALPQSGTHQEVTWANIHLLLFAHGIFVKLPIFSVLAKKKNECVDVVVVRSRCYDS